MSNSAPGDRGAIQGLSGTVLEVLLGTYFASWLTTGAKGAISYLAYPGQLRRFPFELLEFLFFHYATPFRQELWIYEAL